ncbi:unnamed protein product (macronuclear) [Paramecium tetraurelia]|uniref:Transmembrane protein n=1 Tax=Paramecium tetraurelia TaxID=5888 RepID=A0CFI7_PARTE|nr:uncharacterized protein GSPATT00037993001 [Paramecium tetraurelia]CAK69554.1 unnamed protein product [Paramecium tetraurelia]|eukprot:XP_001436951.1 hypothetical protein (macronuclear) [Paramecium tetraurelia strain d4-2]
MQKCCQFKICVPTFLQQLFVEKRLQFIRLNINQFKVPYRQGIFKLGVALIGQSIKIILFYFQIISYTQELSSVFSDQVQQLIHFLGDPFTFLEIFNICQLLVLEVSVLYLQILQNLICMIILMAIFYLFLFCQDFYLQTKNHYDGIIQFHISNIYHFWKFYKIYEIFKICIGFTKIFQITTKIQIILDQYFSYFYPLLLAFGQFYLIYYYKKSKSTLFLSKPIHFKDFGFWFTSYSYNYQHWEFYKFLLVNGLICIIIMIDANAVIKGVFSYSLLIIHTKVCQDNNIYYHKQMNRFEIQLNIISIIILISHSLFSIQDQDSIYKNLILIFINSIFILGGVFMILHLWKLNSKYIRRMCCKVFETLGQFNQIFISYNMFQAHSSGSIKLRKK